MGYTHVFVWNVFCMYNVTSKIFIVIFPYFIIINVFFLVNCLINDFWGMVGVIEVYLMGYILWKFVVFIDSLQSFFFVKKGFYFSWESVFFGGKTLRRFTFYWEKSSNVSLEFRCPSWGTPIGLKGWINFN